MNGRARDLTECSNRVHRMPSNMTHNLFSPITAVAQAEQFQYPTAFVYHNHLQGNNLEGRRIVSQKEYAR
jgi:hypothetical protein